jgi:hypothetical protein
MTNFIVGIDCIGNKSDNQDENDHELNRHLHENEKKTI